MSKVFSQLRPAASHFPNQSLLTMVKYWAGNFLSHQNTEEVFSDILGNVAKYDETQGYFGDRMKHFIYSDCRLCYNMYHKPQVYYLEDWSLLISSVSLGHIISYLVIPKYPWHAGVAWQQPGVERDWVRTGEGHQDRASNEDSRRFHNYRKGPI